MIKTLSKSCDICHDPIGLYKPWYTVRVSPHLKISTRLKNNPMTLCSECFHSYENSLIEMEVEQNHKRNYSEMRK